jgi:protein-disulfide isomerase
METRRVNASIATNAAELTGTLARLDKNGGPTELVVFTDYECPYCRKQHAYLKDVLARDSSIRVGYRHYPLPTHLYATEAARAAICAEQQGLLRELSDSLFATAEWRTQPDWTDIALRVQMDTIVFHRCLADPSTARRLDDDRALAQRLGVSSTPTAVGAGRRLLGLRSDSALLELLRR